MSIAVIKTGGKQHKVKKGDTVCVEVLDLKKGAKIDFEDILGQKKVKVEIIAHKKGPKIKVLKFKNKTRYMRRIGHRQKYTTLKVLEIK